MKKDLLAVALSLLLSACVCVGVTVLYKGVHKPKEPTTPTENVRKDTDILEKNAKLGLPLSFEVDGVVLYPSDKWELGDSFIEENEYMTYSNINAVNFGTPESWLCGLSRYDDANAAVLSYVDKFSSEVDSVNQITMPVFDEVSSVYILREDDEIDFITNYRDSLFVHVTCYTSDLGLAKASFVDATNENIRRL